MRGHRMPPACPQRVKLDTFTTSAQCRLVLQLPTYRCNAADDARGYERSFSAVCGRNHCSFTRERRDDARQKGPDMLNVLCRC